MSTNGIEEQVVTEKGDEQERERPYMSFDLWPYEVAVWENTTRNGGTSYRVQISVSRIEQNGRKRTERLSFRLLDAFAVAKLLQLAGDETLCRIAEVRGRHQQGGS